MIDIRQKHPLSSVVFGRFRLSNTARRRAKRRLRVGPRSAGARPSPVCYGEGGHEPTVTDADLVLGIINGDNRGERRPLADSRELTPK
ncbi:hydantoinase/oxoprolinase family protein [Mesorhizobium retamae]|uniref:hydantoinase/oxoprolinase family protein n=1 Tax=Mesorhizobium retamae TaxID=2912854 RepID=UPI0031BA2A4D